METLDAIGLKYQTEKSSKHHNYLQFYETHLNKIRNHQIVLVEVGIAYGISLKMWSEYFPNGTIIGIDNFGANFSPPNKNDIISRLEHEGIIVIEGEQDDPSIYENLEIDIFIDDGSHRADHQQRILDIVLPHMKTNGFYFIEDLHCTREATDKTFKSTLSICKEFQKTKSWSDPGLNISERINSIEIYEDKLAIITFK